MKNPDGSITLVNPFIVVQGKPYLIRQYFSGTGRFPSAEAVCIRNKLKYGGKSATETAPIPKVAVLTNAGSFEFIDTLGRDYIANVICKFSEPAAPAKSTDAGSSDQQTVIRPE